MNIQQIADNRLSLYSNVVSKKKIKKVIFHTLKNFISFSNRNKENISPQNAEITVRFTNKSEIKRLNFYYRKKNKATDILTFLYQPFPNLVADIVICLPFAKRLNSQRKIPNSHNLCHLLAHGTLHAAGLDHIKKEDAKKMENIEIKTLNYFKISNPYEY